MNSKIYAVYKEGLIPDEVIQFLGSNGSKLKKLLPLNPKIKIRARQGGIHLEADEDTQHEEKIFPLMGPRLDLMALDPPPEIELVLGD